MPSPLEIVQDVVTVARAIYAQAQMVESNKAAWGNLNDVIQQITSSLRGLSELPNTENFVMSLTKLQDQMREIHEFTDKLCKMSYVRRFACAGRHQWELNNYRQGLLELIPLLQLGLSAQPLMDREKDRQREAINRRAELADREAFIKQQEKLLQEKQAAHLREKRDLEAVMQKQMDAFREQLEKNWKPREEAVSKKGPLPEELLVKLYDITFERKVIESRLGDIYHGTWKNQPVLIKLIEGSIHETDRDQFIREARLMSQLRHSAIVPFYGACFERNRMCIVTGRIESTLMHSLNTLSIEERYAISQDLASGLQYFHQQAIFHNDIHPNRVGITQRHAGQWIDLSWIKTELCSMASLGIAHDTTLWQAPEIWRHRERVSQESDVYSFGWLLWTLYTGRMPFPGERGAEFLKAIKDGVRETIPSDCPRHLSELITACWSTDPTQRPTLRQIMTTLAWIFHQIIKFNFLLTYFRNVMSRAEICFYFQQIYKF